MATDDAEECCPACGETAVSVVVTLEPRVVAMRSCNRCDRRWWTADGEPADPVALFARN